MRFLRRVPRRLTRHLLAVAALLAQVVAATGAPVFSPKVAKTAAIPFPCQNHPCGCLTSEECWAGDCCCFTLEEKVAWAAARGVEAPDHARAAIEMRKQKPKAACCAEHEKSCCQAATEPAASAAKPAPAVKWVVGAFVRKCRGDGPAGMLKVDIGAPPPPAPEMPAARPACGRVAAFDSSLSPISLRPPIPPPRVS